LIVSVHKQSGIESHQSPFLAAIVLPQKRHRPRRVLCA
jgi:hypothetical protein